MAKREIDSANRFAVRAGTSALEKRLVIGNPQNSYSKPDALVLAAWLVALADDDRDFDSILRDVRSNCP